MPRYAIVSGSLVVNVIECDAAHALAVGAVADPARTAQPGGSYVAGAFGAPPPGVPQQISRRALRQALAANGHEFDDLRTAIAGVTAVPRRKALRIYLDETMHFRRDDAELVDLLTGLRGISAAQLDLMFIAAGGQAG